MSCEFNEQDTKSYGIMVLAYDILHDDFEHDNLPCDIVFDMCSEIIDKFFKSAEYHNFRLSFYDALVGFVNENEVVVNFAMSKYEIAI